MSKQAEDAAKFAREKLGAKVDEMAGAAGLRVLKGDEGEGGAASKPWIQLPGSGRLLSQFAKDCGACLADEAVFRRESVAVTVNHETGALDVITPSRFRTLIEKYAVPHKIYFESSGVRGGPKVPVNDPASMQHECAKGALDSDEFMSSLRRIARVNQVRMPVMRVDGKVELLREGYDNASQTYTLPSDVVINEEMKPAEGAQILRDYLKEFPFSDERSLAVAIAEMVALYVYGLQELTANRMGFIYKANKVRNGKSLLAMFGITAPYGLPKGQTISNQEEMKKLLDATALQGTPYLFFDNLTGNIKSNLLESYMTTPVWTGRVMGSQKTFDAPKGTIVILTGNNITTSPDIANRCLLCVLYTEDADPQARKLSRIMTPQYIARPKVRGDLLSALWSLVRGWDEAGRPAGSRRIAGFEEWSSLVGGIVVAAGFPDPLEKPKDDDAPDRDEADAREMVKQLVTRMPPGKSAHEFTFQELIDVCVEFKCFDWKLEGKIRGGGDGEPDYFECNSKSASAMGRVFGTNLAGQVFTLDGGVRVRFGKRGHNRHRRYQVEILEEKKG